MARIIWKAAAMELGCCHPEVVFGVFTKSNSYGVQIEAWLSVQDVHGKQSIFQPYAVLEKCLSGRGSKEREKITSCIWKLSISFSKFHARSLGTHVPDAAGLCS